MQFLINLHDQVNTSLGPKATKHYMMTQAQRQKEKVSRQLEAHTQKSNNIKCKEAKEFSKIEVDFERLKKKHKSMS